MNRLADQRGFTFNELLVVMGIIGALLASSLFFFQGQFHIAQQQKAVEHLAAGVRAIRTLPEGNPLSWEAAANRRLTESLDVPAHTAATPAGTQVNVLPNGVHVGRTAVANQALMNDTSGATVAFSGSPPCAVNDIQFAMHTASLPSDNLLFETDAEWLSATLQIGAPELIIKVTEDALFCCLPLL